MAEEPEEAVLQLRRRVADRLKNPRILRITFHTFRHWKATTLYHQTKDILCVMRFLGHKNIRNTLIYVQLEEAIFERRNEELVSREATTVEEVCKPIEAGFEYVCDVNDARIFRKRKQKAPIMRRVCRMVRGLGSHIRLYSTFFAQCTPREQSTCGR